jgi:hypothetical protein
MRPLVQAFQAARLRAQVGICSPRLSGGGAAAVRERHGRPGHVLKGPLAGQAEHARIAVRELQALVGLISGRT